MSWKTPTVQICCSAVTKNIIVCFLFGKVEKTLTGSLNWISSPSISMKIQNMGERVCLRRQNIAEICQQTFESKKFVDITQQCFALLLQVNCHTYNLNFYWRWRWWDQISWEFFFSAALTALNRPKFHFRLINSFIQTSLLRSLCKRQECLWLSPLF